MSSRLIPEQEIADWFDQPITQLFYQLVEKALADCHEDKRNAFQPNQPFTTQERLAWLHGAEWAFGEIIGMREDQSIGEVNE